jgi:hypothetical protein
MASGVVTLGEIGATRSVLDIACNRCDRRGKRRVRTLIAEHGADLPVPALRQIVAADCPKMIEGKVHDVCGVHFPGLSTVLNGIPPVTIYPIWPQGVDEK